MLEEKISALRNERATRTICRIELDLPFRIDDTYFLSELDKLNFYREIENIDTIEELEEIERDMHYRAQKKSESHTYDAGNLFLLLRSRIILSEAGIERVSKNGQFYVLEFPRGTQANTVKSFLDAFDRDRRMILVSLEKIRIDARVFRDAADFLEKLLPERS